MVQNALYKMKLLGKKAKKPLLKNMVQYIPLKHKKFNKRRKILHYYDMGLNTAVNPQLLKKRHDKLTNKNMVLIITT